MVNSTADTAPTRTPRLQAAAHPAAIALAPHGARAGFPPAPIVPRSAPWWRRAPSWRLAAPSALTAAGLLLGLVGATLLPSPAGALCLGLALFLDVADGCTARRLGASTAAGARFDLATDVALAHCIAWAAWPRAVAAVVSAALVAVVVFARGRRVSGRVAVSVAAIVWSWRWGGWTVAPDAVAAWAAGLSAAALGCWLAGREVRA